MTNNDSKSLKIPAPAGICKRCALDNRQTKFLPGIPGMLLSYCPHSQTGGHIVLTADRPMWHMFTPLTSLEWSSWVKTSLEAARELSAGGGHASVPH